MNKKEKGVESKLKEVNAKKESGSSMLGRVFSKLFTSKPQQVGLKKPAQKVNVDLGAKTQPSGDVKHEVKRNASNYAERKFSYGYHYDMSEREMMMLEFPTFALGLESSFVR